MPSENYQNDVSLRDAQPPEKWLGRKLGKYRLQKVLGAGGMGVVFEGHDTYLKRPVAVKILREAIAADRMSLKRFLEEARAIAKLNHPHVVPIFDIDRSEGTAYIVMELLRGGTLQHRIDRMGSLPWAEATRQIAAIARALQVAHAAGMVHRDVKPSNIFLDDNGTPKLGDFGLVKQAAPSQTGLTSHGAVLGTPHFMSPEQCRGERVDLRSDIYSLGATYYMLLTGRPPFPGTNPLQIQFGHCSSPIPDPRQFQSGAPAASNAVLQKAMAKEPHDRFAAASEMAEALEAIPSSEVTPIAPTTVSIAPLKIRRTSAWRWATIAIPLACLIGIAWWIWAGQKESPGNNVASQVPGTLRGKITDKGFVAARSESRIRSVEFSPDGLRLAYSRFLDGKKGAGGVVVLDTSDGAEYFAAWTEDVVRGVAFSPDGKMLAACTGGMSHGEIHLRSMVSDAPLPDLKGPSANIRCLAFSPDSKTLLVGRHPMVESRGGKRNVLTLWDVTKFQEIWRAEIEAKPNEMVNAVAFSNEGDRFVAGSDGGVLESYDAKTRTLTASQSYGPSIAALAILPKTRLLAVGKAPPNDKSVAGYSDVGVDIVHVDNLTLDATLTKSATFSLAVSRDGRWLAAGGARDITVWDLRDRQPVLTLRGHTQEVRGLSFAPDGAVLASASFDRALRLWDLSGPIQNAK